MKEPNRNKTIWSVRIKKLELNAFRPFNYLDFDFNRELTLIIGNNGAGKTSILDATAILLRKFVDTVFYSDESTKTFISGKDVNNGQNACDMYLTLEIDLPKEFISLDKIQGLEEKQGEAFLEKILEEDKDDTDSWEHYLSIKDEISPLDKKKYLLEACTRDLSLNDKHFFLLPYESGYQSEDIRFGLAFNKYSDEEDVRLIDFDDNLNYIKSIFQAAYYEEYDALPLLVYYGANKLDAVEPESIKREKKHYPTAHDVYHKSLTPEPANFTAFYEWFDAETRLSFTQKQESVSLALAKEKILAFLNLDKTKNSENMGVYSNLRMRYQKRTSDLVVDKQIAVGQKPITVEVGQMSSGEKHIIALVGDLVRRVVAANLGEEVLGVINDKDPNNPILVVAANLEEECYGLVLIDELDLHLHPKWQYHILSNLRKHFANIHFGITSHSPFVTADSEAENIEILGEGTPLYSEGHGVEYILSELMDVDPRGKELEDILSKISFGEYKEEMSLKFDPNSPEAMRINFALQRYKFTKNEKNK